MVLLANLPQETNMAVTQALAFPEENGGIPMTGWETANLHPISPGSFG